MNATTLDQIRRNFAALGPVTGASLLAGFNREAALLAHAGVTDSFARQVSPEGVPWKKLAHPRPRGGSLVLQDTGRLRNSCKATATATQIVLTASHPGANVHQYGATIRPVRAKRLAVPMTREAARVGSPRGRFPRPLFVLVARTGSLFLAESKLKGRGKKRKPETVLQYALRASVTVPARPFVGFSEETLRKIDRLYADRVEEFVTDPFRYLSSTKSATVAKKWG
jgi:phage gpG-like protein